MISWVVLFVLVTAQKTRGVSRRVDKGDIVQPSSSDGCSVNVAQLIVRPSKRAGVPVFNRAIGRPASRICWPRLTAAASPVRPPSSASSPRNNFPLRKVPVAKIVACASTVLPSASLIPETTSPSNNKIGRASCRERV